MPHDHDEQPAADPAAEREALAALLAWKRAVDGPRPDVWQVLGCPPMHPTRFLGRRDADLYRAAEAYEATLAPAEAGR